MQPFSQVLRGSLRAVITGWILGVIVTYFPALVISPMLIQVSIISPWNAFARMFPYVFLTWLLVCLPLYNNIPLKSPLWKRSTCVLCGGLFGPLMFWFIPIVITSWFPHTRSTFVVPFLNYTPNISYFEWKAVSLATPTAMFIGIFSCWSASTHRNKYLSAPQPVTTPSERAQGQSAINKNLLAYWTTIILGILFFYWAYCQ
jgi:hypothetical protein